MPSRIQHADIDILARLFKGELTMGDHVIGTTPGGFKIHASRGPSHESYAGMKSGDHIVAANMHAKAARDLNIKSGQMGGSMTLKRQAANHLHLATTHREAGSGTPQKLAASLANRGGDTHAPLLYTRILRKAAGDRGGKVIGRTASGKAIYQSHKPSSKEYKGFTASEHREAADIHAKTSQAIGDKSDRKKTDNVMTRQGDFERSRAHSDMAVDHRRAAGRIDRISDHD